MSNTNTAIQQDARNIQGSAALAIRHDDRPQMERLYREIQGKASVRGLLGETSDELATAMGWS